MLVLRLMGLGLLLGAVAGCTSDARTRQYHLQKWCLSAMTEELQCGFATFEQCETTRAGVGGTCYVNPRLTEASPIGRQRQGR